MWSTALSCVLHVTVLAAYHCTQAGQVLWFSDVALDVAQDDYKDDSDSDCIGLGKNTSATYAADLKCYTSGHAWGTVLSGMKQAAASPDFIVWLGGSSAVGDTRLEAVKQVVDDLGSSYSGVAVYPVPGTFDFAIDEDALDDGIDVDGDTYGQLQQLWADWLTDDAKETFASDGYYAAELSDGAQLLALNTVPMMKDAYNDSAADAQLDWLETALVDAANASRAVVVIGHTGPGAPGRPYDAVYGTVVRLERKYNDRLATLLATYNNTVKLALFGGAHVDSFLLLNTQDHEDPVKDELTGKVLPQNFLLNSGSVAPFTFDQTEKMATFKVLSLGEGMVVDEIDTWSCNTRQSACSLDYSFTDAYKLDNISLTSLLELSKKLDSDADLFYAYSNRTLAAPEDPAVNATCDAACRRWTLCAVSHANARDFDDCANEKTGRFWAAVIFGLVLVVLLLLLCACAFAGNDNNRGDYESF